MAITSNSNRIRLLWSLWIATAFIGCKAFPQQQTWPENSFDDQDAPQITPADETELKVGSKLTLYCEHHDNVEWRMLDFTFKRDEYEFEYGSDVDNERYSTTITRYDVDHNDVGYYYCISKKANIAGPLEELNDKALNELLDRKLASRVYVYVDDPNHLLVPTENVKLAFENNVLIVPCKPTMKNIDVTLTTLPNNKKVFSNNSTQYDHRIGFTTSDRAKSYECRPAKHDSEKIVFSLNDTGTKHNNSETKTVPTPIITSPSNGHGFVNSNIELKCEARTESDATIRLSWNHPVIDELRVHKTPLYKDNSSGIHSKIVYTTLTLSNAKKSDSGNYSCKAEVLSTKLGPITTVYAVSVLDEAYIDLKALGNNENHSTNAGGEIKLNIDCPSFPIAEITWQKDGKEISNSSRTAFFRNKHSLHIYKTSLQDSGDYVVIADNGILTKRLIFRVGIKDKPQVKLNDIYVSIGIKAQLTCRVLSLPQAKVSWTFVPCDITPWPKCDRTQSQTLESTAKEPGDSSIETLHTLEFWPERAGKMICTGENERGTDTSEAFVYVLEIAENMMVSKNDDSKIASGDEVTITCSVLAYHFSSEIRWYKEEKAISAEDFDAEFFTDQSNYTYHASIRFPTILDNDAGNYKCSAIRKEPPFDWLNKTIALNVNKPFKPNIISNITSKMTREAGGLVEVECRVQALPIPSITWFYNGDVLLENDNIIVTETITTDEEKYSILRIKSLSRPYEGDYECLAKNRLGEQIVRTEINIADDSSLHAGWIVAIVFFFIVLIALVIYLWIRVNRERKLVRELKLSGLHNFVEGDPTHINRALNLDEQADLLPYDKSFEFPRHKLEMGKQLGAGAFGVVRKAYATGIKPDEEKSVVAVKMVKRIADNEAMRALVSELKILIHLGQHLNVVNLLGAVTKNVANRELMVIVEYCRYGNVQNFLMQNRKSFINQINAQTGKIDPSIMTQRFSDNFETSRNGLRYANINFSINRNNNIIRNNHSQSDSDPRPGTRAGRPNSNNEGQHTDSYENQMDSCATNQTVMTTIHEDECTLLSNNSAPPWRSNYKTDSTEAMTVTTSDLVSWAFQVARGMDYLSSRKVLHGDLAARNVLLCENNIVKICDFGLARSMLKSEIYKKEGEAPLPIKWLALESFSDRVFSTYTDVWSFGIVLWEFFSLAKVPYTGMAANTNLYEQLKNGYRMEKPPYANDDLYDIMLQCWSTNPESRPLFNELENKFARLLGDEVTNHYVDMNEPYLRANNEYFKKNTQNYMELLGSPPDEEAPAPPRYVNTNVLPEIRATQGSPIMSKLDRSSPSPQRNRSKPAIELTGTNRLPEEIPMLQKEHQGADDYDVEGGDYLRSINAPTHQTSSAPKPSPRKHIAETPLNGNNENYVNLKTPKKQQALSSKIKNADAFSNPSYEPLKVGTK